MKEIRWWLGELWGKRVNWCRIFNLNHCIALCGCWLWFTFVWFLITSAQTHQSQSSWMCQNRVRIMCNARTWRGSGNSEGIRGQRKACANGATDSFAAHYPCVCVWMLRWPPPCNEPSTNLFGNLTNSIHIASLENSAQQKHENKNNKQNEPYPARTPALQLKKKTNTVDSLWALEQNGTEQSRENERERKKNDTNRIKKRQKNRLGSLGQVFYYSLLCDSYFVNLKRL